MTQYRFTFEVSHRREKGESAGVGVAGTVEHRAGGPITVGAGPQSILAPTISTYTSARLQQIDIILTAGFGAAVPGSRLRSWRGLTGWYIDIPAPAAQPNTFYANLGNEQSFQLQTVFGDHKDVCVISGAAGAAVADLTLPGVYVFSALTSKDLNLWGAGTPRSSSILADWYLDTQLGDALPNLASVCKRYLKSYQAQGGGTLVLGTSGNQKIWVPYCAAAWGKGPPIVIAADLGNNFGQIPINPADWTAERFAVHPRLFVRPSTFSYGAAHLYPTPIADPDPITADVALYPNLATRKPTHSVWRILLEGNVMDVVIKHPDAGDYRRPRDIWSKVWVPAISQSGFIETFDSYLIGLAPNFTRSFFSRGILGNLDFLDWAYCLDLLDADGGTPLVEFPEV